MSNKVNKQKQVKKVEPLKSVAPHRSLEREAVGMLTNSINLPRRVVLQIAEEVAKIVTMSLKRGNGKKKKIIKAKEESSLFLDTSAIIDGRVFDLIKIGVFVGNFVVIEGVLSELKNIADSKDDVKRERGKKGLRLLDDLKRINGARVIVMSDEEPQRPVDERIISTAKKNKGRVITCDFNLSKKARISGVISIDLYEVANVLKTQALPGEIFWVKIIQKGKGESQGVGYLPDGTMLVVERAENLIGKTVQVLISRVIQTDAGRIFFGKMAENV